MVWRSNESAGITCDMWIFLGRTPTIFIGYFKSSCHFRVLEPPLVSLWTWLLSFMRISPIQINCLLGSSFLRFFFILCGPLKKKKNGYWISYNTASMFCFYGHEACGILAARPGTEPIPPALEGDVITTGLLGKSPEIFLFLFSHKIWSLEGDLFLLSAHVLCFVSAQVFHILCSPATWIHRVAKKYCGFPFHTQFPRKNFSWDHCLNKSRLFK